MFDLALAPSHQLRASLGIWTFEAASFGSMMRCPRCDVVGPTEIKSINPRYAAATSSFYQCGHCGAEHDGTLGNGAIVYMS